MSDQNHPDPKARWKNMRYMAYVGITAGVVMTVSAIVQGELKDMAVELLSFWGFVIGAYMGASTAQNGWGKNRD